MLGVAVAVSSASAKALPAQEPPTIDRLQSVTPSIAGEPAIWAADGTRLYYLKLNPQNCRRDQRLFRRAPVDDGVMQFTRAPVRPPREAERDPAAGSRDADPVARG